MTSIFKYDANGKNGQDKSAEELATQSTYTNWDFETVWTWEMIVSASVLNMVSLLNSRWMNIIWE